MKWIFSFILILNINYSFAETFKKVPILVSGGSHFIIDYMNNVTKHGVRELKTLLLEGKGCHSFDVKFESAFEWDVANEISFGGYVYCDEPNLKQVKLFIEFDMYYKTPMNQRKHFAEIYFKYNNGESKLKLVKLRDYHLY